MHTCTQAHNNSNSLQTINYEEADNVLIWSCFCAEFVHFNPDECQLSYQFSQWDGDIDGGDDNNDDDDDGDDGDYNETKRDESKKTKRYKPFLLRIIKIKKKKTLVMSSDSKDLCTDKINSDAWQQSQFRQ